MSSTISKEEIFLIFVAFFMYYVILFLEAYVALRLFFYSTDKNLLKDVNFHKDKNQFKKAYKNIILSYIVGFASVPVYAITKDVSNETNIIASLISIPGAFISFAFGPRTLPKDFIYFVAIIVSFLAGVIIHYFFTFKKMEMSKIKRAFSALIFSLLSAPYFFMFSYYYI